MERTRTRFWCGAAEQSLAVGPSSEPVRVERPDGLGALFMLKWQDNLSLSAKPCSQRNGLRCWRLPLESEEEAIDIDDLNSV